MTRTEAQVADTAQGHEDAAADLRRRLRNRNLKRAAIFTTAFLSLTNPAVATDSPLGSFSYRSSNLACDGLDHYVTTKPGMQGAGNYPTNSFEIVGVNLFAVSSDPESIVVVGVLGGLGDLVTPFVVGTGSVPWSYPSGTGYMMQPGYEVHLHNVCASGDRMWAGFTILYKLTP